jgi:predicted transcriptional regulator
MITTRHRTMLRAICACPRTAREFTNAQHDALSPNACASHLNELVKQGLIEVNEDGLYEATEAGHGFNSQPSTPPRTFCNATTKGTYTGPAWTLRAGADRAAAIPSRGTGC